MAGPPLDAVETDEATPSRVDVAIAGGGIIGMLTALALVQKGLSVLVCEKGRVAAEQSSWNWGWCRVSRRDPREIPLAVEASRMWPGLNALVQGESGYRQTGILFGCDTDKSIADAEEWLEYAKPFLLISRGPGEVAKLLPGSARPLKAALYTPGDGRGEPQKVVPALTKAGSPPWRRGGRTLRGPGARRRGRARRRHRDRTRPCRRRRCCSGWRCLVAPLPTGPEAAPAATQGPEHGPSRRADPRPARWRGLDREFAFRKRLDGGYTTANGMNNVVPIVPARSGSPSISFRRFDSSGARSISAWTSGSSRNGATGRSRAPTRSRRSRSAKPSTPIRPPRRPPPPMRATAEFFPRFNSAKVAHQWAGMIDATPDALPVISGVDQLPGFFIATASRGTASELDRGRTSVRRPRHRRTA